MAYPYRNNLKGRDADIYHMMSGIYGTMSELDFKEEQFGNNIIDTIEKLYYMITNRNIRVYLNNAIAKYNEKNPDIEYAKDTIELAIKEAKVAFILVTDRADTDRVLLNNYRIATKVLSAMSNGEKVISNGDGRVEFEEGSIVHKEDTKVDKLIAKKNKKTEEK
jgi:hypothetical protein